MTPWGLLADGRAPHEKERTGGAGPDACAQSEIFRPVGYHPGIHGVLPVQKLPGGPEWR